MERHLNTLRSATKRVEECKVQVEQAKIATGVSFEEVAEWSLGVENKQRAADENIEYLKRCLAEGKQRRPKKPFYMSLGRNNWSSSKHNLK